MKLINLSLATLVGSLMVCAAAHSQIAGFGGPDPAVEAKMKEAAKQPTPRTSNGRPDLSGYWETPMSGAFAAIPKLKSSADGKKLEPPAGLGVGDVNALDVKNVAARAANVALRPVYKAEFAAKAKANFEQGDLADPSYGCKSPGVPRIGMPSEIVQTPQAVYLLYGTQNRYRIIPIDGRKHDPAAESMPNGDSIGSWEGDTLVIDTVNLSDNTWIDRDGSYHSADMRVTERFTRTGDVLTIDVTVEDPIFAKPFKPLPGIPFGPAGTLVLGKRGEHVAEDYPCEERSRPYMINNAKH